MKKLIFALAGLLLTTLPANAGAFGYLISCQIKFTGSSNQVWVGVYRVDRQRVVQYFPVGYFEYCPSQLEFDEVRW